VDSRPTAGARHKPRHLSIGAQIAAFARKYATGLNHRYLTGGTSPASGWDCTYFAAFIWQLFGFDADPDFGAGTHYFDTNALGISPTSKTDSPQLGALVFEAGAEGTVADPGHVGVLVSVHPLLMVAAADSARGTVYQVPQQVSGHKIPAGGW
jgi:cell wall-associated NlpC family hydrolase